MIGGISRVYTDKGLWPIQGLFRTGDPNDLEVGLTTHISPTVTQYTPYPRNIRAIGLIPASPQVVAPDSSVTSLAPGVQPGMMAYEQVSWVTVSIAPAYGFVVLTANAAIEVTKDQQFMRNGLWVSVSDLMLGDVVAMHPNAPLAEGTIAPVATTPLYSAVTGIVSVDLPTQYTINPSGIGSYIAEGFLLHS